MALGETCIQSKVDQSCPGHISLSENDMLDMLLAGDGAAA